MQTSWAQIECVLDRAIAEKLITHWQTVKLTFRLLFGAKVATVMANGHTAAHQTAKMKTIKKNVALIEEHLGEHIWKVHCFSFNTRPSDYCFTDKEEMLKQCHSGWNV